MEERDIRIYIYDPGSLKKIPPNHKHKHKSIESAEELIKRLQENPKFRFDRRQFVITEYTGVYQSSIIKIINPL